MKKLIFSFLLMIFFIKTFSQETPVINGNFNLIAQTYKQDTLIGANSVPEYLRLNSYANLYFRYKNFTAGVRYEGYFNTLQGYNPKNDGFGFPYRFAEYNSEVYDLTVGNFYEQFGNGLVLRSYEDKNIGYDNAFDGVRFKFFPVKGIYFKGLVARQRLSFSKNNLGFSNVVYKGLVRAIDLEISLNELIDSLTYSPHQILFGFSFVSKYQPYEAQYVNIDDTTIVELNLPLNVAAFSGRLNYSFKNFSISAEYAFKSQDPSADNNFIFKNGQAIFINTSYSKRGFGLLLSLIHIDNFSFRSDRNAALNDLSINYIPDITKNHTYSLVAMYPFVSQNIGERGVAVEFTKKFKRNTFFGGKYGTNLSFNFSRMHQLKKIPIADSIPVDTKGTLGYFTDFFSVGDLLYQDISFSVSKKFSRKVKLIALYQNLYFNYPILRGKPEHSDVYANTFVLDFTYKFDRKHSLRTEAQALFTKQDMGNWAALLLEYSISPHWFFSIGDELNYANPNTTAQTHYYKLFVAYKKEALRLQIGYARQRAGIICIGGVCREVPAANGFNFTISTSF